MRNLTLVILLVCTMLIGGASYAYANRHEHVNVRIPVCTEDARYLKGKGDFDGTRWDRYVCVSTEKVES